MIDRVRECLCWSEIYRLTPGAGSCRAAYASRLAKPVFGEIPSGGYLRCRADEVREKFERFGEIRDVYLPRDFHTGYGNNLALRIAPQYQHKGDHCPRQTCQFGKQEQD